MYPQSRQQDAVEEWMPRILLRVVHQLGWQGGLRSLYQQLRREDEAASASSTAAAAPAPNDLQQMVQEAVVAALASQQAAANQAAQQQAAASGAFDHDKPGGLLSTGQLFEGSAYKKRKHGIIKLGEPLATAGSMAQVFFFAGPLIFCTTVLAIVVQNLVKIGWSPALALKFSMMSMTTGCLAGGAKGTAGLTAGVTRLASSAVTSHGQAYHVKKPVINLQM
eukprot:Skav235387  [mRNA]  locus=scaffold1262:297202:302173:- [translate_table: standard]